MFIVKGYCGDFHWLVAATGSKVLADQLITKLEAAALQATKWIEESAPVTASDFTDLFKEIDPTAGQYAPDLGDMLDWTISETPVIIFKDGAICLAGLSK